MKLLRPLKVKSVIDLVIVLSCFFSLALLASETFATANIKIVNNDGVGEGFNDSSAFTAVAGNTASTLGQARLNALQHAANILGSLITSTIDINVLSQMSALGGSASSATLGYASPSTLHANFTNAPVANTYYHRAIAEKLSGENITSDGISYEVTMTFNSDIDGSVVLSTDTWYYGLDATPSGTDIDFITVVLHEMLHGIGFATFVSLSSGVKYGGINDVYMTLLEHHGATVSDYPSMTNAQRVTASISDTDLHWLGAAVISNEADVSAGKTGTHIQLFAPNPSQSGSSVSHFNTALTPNQIMEPSYTSATHSIGMAAHLLNDVGWGATHALTTAIDVQVTQTDSAANITIGTNETYNLVVTNNAASTATDVFISNMIPAGSTIVSATPTAGSCFNANNVISCYLGNLVSSGTVNITVIVTLNVAGTNTNTVYVSSANPDNSSSNNTSSEASTVTANNVDLAVTQTNSSTTIDYASNETYAVTVTNNSSTDNAFTVVLSVTLPSNAVYSSYSADDGWSCAHANNIVTCNKLSLALSSSTNVSIIAALNTEGSNSNTVSISSLNPDPSSSNDSSTVLTTVGPEPVVESTAGSGGCFIATAAYGTNMFQEVRYLRGFRDQYLLTNVPGRWFVKKYYRYSPAIANVIRNNQAMKQLIRIALAPMVKISEWLVSDYYLKLQNKKEIKSHSTAMTVPAAKISN